MPAGASLENLCVVLVATRNPLNIGAAARAMSNFGCFSLRLVNPYEVAFREARSAVGARNVLERATEHKTLSEAIAGCTLVVGTTALGHRELQHPLKRLEYGGRLIKRHLETGPVALLFGSEKFGLSNEEMSYCHWLMRIPARREHESMNLGQAVAVSLYELVRDSRAVSKAPKPVTLASAGEMDRVTDELMKLLQESGYVHGRTASSSTQKIRRLIRRMGLSARDAEVWLGMIRQIAWKLHTRE